MKGAQIILGIDDRVDEKGDLHPWRIVAMGSILPEGKSQYLMALPSDRRYFSTPRHPHYGDLTLIENDAKEQITRLVKQLTALGVASVHLEMDHKKGVIGRTMIWNGIEPVGYDVPDQPEGMTRDPFSIGGDAGHQIAEIEYKLRNTQ